ncbi:hypothetical protein DL95DRAFT_427339 [Leptodontidium sp. 2 PMI_412]|nr:hypothetical protein DL95DRAFT_427339 [Leptodontidium sp. 2 PMI_412]
MLILVAGVTRYLGKHLAQVGVEKGHQVRGFGRSSNKLPAELLGKLESFVQCEWYDDRAALYRAVTGADAVICCYTSHADAVLEAQISLLRALTSPVKPVYVFTGLAGEFCLSDLLGIAHLEDAADGKVLKYWGDGNAKWDFTYFEDAARFSIDLVTTSKSVLAGEGGFFNVRSAEASTIDIRKAYEKRSGEKLKLQSLGGVQELKTVLENARASTDPRLYFAFANYYSQLANTLGTWKMDNPKEAGAPDAIERLFDNHIEIPKVYT